MQKKRTSKLPAPIPWVPWAPIPAPIPGLHDNVAVSQCFVGCAATEFRQEFIHLHLAERGWQVLAGDPGDPSDILW